MKHYLTYLFGENRSISMMRLMSFSSCLTAIVIAFVGLCKAQPDYLACLAYVVHF